MTVNKYIDYQLSSNYSVQADAHPVYERETYQKKPQAPAQRILQNMKSALTQDFRLNLEDQKVSVLSPIKQDIQQNIDLDRVNGQICVMRDAKRIKNGFFKKIDGIPTIIKFFMSVFLDFKKQKVQKLYDEVIDTVIEQLNPINDENFSLLKQLVVENDVETLKVLLEKRVDVNRVDKDGRSLLHFAAAEKNKPMIQLLFRQIDFTLRDREERSMTDVFYDGKEHQQPREVFRVWS